MLCRRCFTKDAGADLYFLIQKNWHISVTKDLEIFSSMADICDQSKGDGLSFFSLSVLVCVHACACMCVYTLKKAIKPNILLSMTHLINS